MREIKIRATEKEIADLIKALQGLHAAESEDPNEPQREIRRMQQEIAWTNDGVNRVRRMVENLKLVCTLSVLLSTTALVVALILL